MEKTDEYVKYDVVYPMPLVEMKSKYTNKDGNRINVNFYMTVLQQVVIV